MRERPLSMDVDGGDLTLSGVVDEDAVPALRTLLADLLESGDPVSVDLGDVDYLPSFAIGVLARARSRALARDVPFELLAPDGTPAQRVLQIAAIPYVDGSSDGPTDTATGTSADTATGTATDGDGGGSGGSGGTGASRSEVS